jgi:hypothetical protein
MHLVTKAGEHSADLAVLALVEHHLQHGALLVLRTDRDPLGMHLRLREPDAAVQSVDELLAGHARDLDEIFLLHAISRVGQEVGEAAVVGDQNQTLAHPVEPADREEPLFTGHEIDHPRTARGIEVGRDHAHRLVEHVDDPLRVWQPFAVYTNLLGLRIDSAPERGHHLPINLDAARRDQFLARAAAA